MERTKTVVSEKLLQNKSKYRREGDALTVLSSWRESGLSLRAFAQRQGLSLSRLARWKARLRTSGPLLWRLLSSTKAQWRKEGVLRDRQQPGDANEVVDGVESGFPTCMQTRDRIDCGRSSDPGSHGLGQRPEGGLLLAADIPRNCRTSVSSR